METQGDLNSSGSSYLKLILIFVGLTLSILAIFLIIQIVNKSKNASLNPKDNIVATSSTSEEIEKDYVLPSVDDQGNGISSSTKQSEDAVEKYFPGDFYKGPSAQIDFSATYELPLNIKIDAANYYDFSRKINLDSVLANLNSSGFAIIDNPFSAAQNFYEAYGALDSQEIPPLITSDFLIYYYQNINKLVYKKIEGAVFYNALWETNKKLYDTAKARYEKKSADNLIVNDVSLEGARREMAFLAVSLLLLQPEEGQVDNGSGLDSDGKFSPAEAENFSFYPPDYLKKDVLSEVALIRSAKESVKSPVLLYARDYKDFAVPSEYRTNERLKNFYLSSRWLNSVWPLYAKNDDCLNCFLDKEDWAISFYAALLLSDDLASSQDLKNKWAQVYKIKSFFTGLRSDLNYLHYRAAMDNVFGMDKKAEDVLVGDNIKSGLNSLAEEISKVEFPLIEGGRNKQISAEKPYIGLKMLAEAQWPSDYIFSTLTATSVGVFKSSSRVAQDIPTACIKGGSVTRCLPSAIDIIGLLSDSVFTNSYFIANADYEFYFNKADDLKKELSLFTDASWHSNSFWLSLDMMKKSLSASPAVRPVFARNDSYHQREFSLAMSSFVNSQLPPDIFALNEKNSSRLNRNEQNNELVSYGYIEPNQVLVGELLANSKMTIDFLTALKIGDQGGAALYDLKNMEKNLSSIKAIVEKEAKGEELSDEDYKFIANFYSEFIVNETGNKTLEINNPLGAQKMQEKLSGLKMLLVIYARGQEKIIVAGPIFNYKEVRVGK